VEIGHLTVVGCARGLQLLPRPLQLLLQAPPILPARSPPRPCRGRFLDDDQCKPAHLAVVRGRRDLSVPVRIGAADVHPDLSGRRNLPVEGFPHEAPWTAPWRRAPPERSGGDPAALAQPRKTIRTPRAYLPGLVQTCLIIPRKMGPSPKVHHRSSGLVHKATLRWMVFRPERRTLGMGSQAVVLRHRS